MTRKEDIELALLRRKKNNAEVNTFQLFVLENKLEFV